MVKRTLDSAPKGERVNLRTLADYLELSQTTVSLVLNNSPSAKSIPQETRDRVIAAAAKLNYRPNYFARSLRQKRSMSIAVLTPDLSEGYFTMVMNGVQQELIPEHYFYFTANHDWRADLIEEYPRMLMQRAVDGFLLLNTPADFSVNVPVVSISGHNKNPSVTNITLDHDLAAHLALDHLYKLGHRDIAFMRGPQVIVDSEFRWSGIENAARQHDLILRPELCLQLESSGWSPEFAYRQVQDLLSRRRDFTALFCFNDIAATGAIRAILNAGLSVPGDISVLGFDDIMSAAYTHPSLTTVRQPLEEMGRKGARTLLDRIQTPATEPLQEIILAPELIVRESTGPAPKR